MAGTLRECFLNSVNNDPNLHGEDFLCKGSKADNPLKGGKLVGVQIRYQTLDDSFQLVESRKNVPLRGCVYFVGEACEKDQGVCKVASVLPMVDFRNRQSKLRKMEKVSIRTSVKLHRN